MQYAYQKLMKEYGLSLNDLPEDAKHGIEAILNIEKAINMAERNGDVVPEKTYAKIKANDKWVVQEIMDYVEDDDENDDEMPYDEEEIIDEIESQKDEKKPNQPKLTKEQMYALEIENELSRMYQSGKKQWRGEDIREFSDIIFEAVGETYHQNDDENGIETSKYSLVETEELTFTLKKK